MTIYLVIAETWFHGAIRGGSMPMGPKGVIAIEDGYCPAWAKQTFDESDLQADDPTDDGVKELKALIEAGHARVLEHVRYMHVSSKVTGTILHEDEEDKDEDEEEEEEEEEDEEKKVAEKKQKV